MAMTTKKTPRTTLGSRLNKGFDSLTLDPSPRLHQARLEMSRAHPLTMADVWTTVARALAEAVKVVAPGQLKDSRGS